MNTIEKPRTEKATRPASRWRNRYLALRTFREPHHPVIRVGGKEFVGIFQWPSRDTAETYGQSWEKENPTFGKYLGAFPVESA